jgi:hypothetical protein
MQTFFKTSSRSFLEAISNIILKLQATIDLSLHITSTPSGWLLIRLFYYPVPTSEANKKRRIRYTMFVNDGICELWEEAVSTCFGILPQPLPR